MKNFHPVLSSTLSARVRTSKKISTKNKKIETEETTSEKQEQE